MSLTRTSLLFALAAALTIPLVAQQSPAPSASPVQGPPQQSQSLVEYDDEVQRAAPNGVDFTGEWAPRFHEDEPERVPGPELGDYLGIPINDAARLRALAWEASIQTLPEWQCRPHSADYIWRGPSPLRIWKEVDPVSRQVVAWHAEWLRSVDRSIYMDGRPHPSPNAPHTWAGFSTGTWDRHALPAGNEQGGVRLRRSLRSADRGDARRRRNDVSRFPRQDRVHYVEMHRGAAMSHRALAIGIAAALAAGPPSPAASAGQARG